MIAFNKLIFFYSPITSLMKMESDKLRASMGFPYFTKSDDVIAKRKSR